MGWGRTAALVAWSTVALAPSVATADGLVVTGDAVCISTPTGAPSFVDRAFPASEVVVFEEHPPVVSCTWHPIDWYEPGNHAEFTGVSDQLVFGNFSVKSFLVHFDPTGAAGAYAMGSIQFPGSIAGVMARGTTLVANDGAWGVPGATYDVASTRGLEAGDVLWWDAAGQLGFSLDGSDGLDEVRVLVANGPVVSCDGGGPPPADGGALDGGGIGPGLDGGGSTRRDAGSSGEAPLTPYDFRGVGGCSCRAASSRPFGGSALAAFALLALAFARRMGR